MIESLPGELSVSSSAGQPASGFPSETTQLPAVDSTRRRHESIRVEMKALPRGIATVSVSLPNVLSARVPP